MHNWYTPAAAPAAFTVKAREDPEPTEEIEVLAKALGLVALGTVHDTATRIALESALTFGMSDPTRMTV